MHKHCILHGQLAAVVCQLENVSGTSGYSGYAVTSTAAHLNSWYRCFYLCSDDCARTIDNTSESAAVKLGLDVDKATACKCEMLMGCSSLQERVAGGHTD